MNIEIIRNTLYKAYLESFYGFCKSVGGTTADVMCEILAVSGDWAPIKNNHRHKLSLNSGVKMDSDVTRDDIVS